MQHATETEIAPLCRKHNIPRWEPGKDVVGPTGYVDQIWTGDLPDLAVRLKDEYGRPCLSFETDWGIVTIFQRYSGDPSRWVSAGGPGASYFFDGGLVTMNDLAMIDALLEGEVVKTSLYGDEFQMALGRQPIGKGDVVRLPNDEPGEVWTAQRGRVEVMHKDGLEWFEVEEVEKIDKSDVE